MSAPAPLDDPRAARTGDAQWLSVALMDARNRTLRWLACMESAGRLQAATPGLAAPWWWVGRAGWFQEHWVARNVQRARGASADPGAARLASSEPLADTWFLAAAPERPDPPEPPSPQALRGYLAATLETTLELLERAEPDDAGLHVFRLVLRHEDRLCERLATVAQWLGVAPDPGAGLGAPPVARVAREALWIPSRRFQPGCPPGEPGLVPPAEVGGPQELVPEFEIDAQAVSWGRFVPFAEDGGYDDPRWWSPQGWAWLQGSGRRAPRGVAQWRGAVVLERFGRLVRVPAGEAAAHVSLHEAQAWCQWAGRRLPAEIEWELAACVAASRGFAWGDVREWVAGRARPWSTTEPQPVAGLRSPDPAQGLRVLRGASSWTVPRERHLRARVCIGPARDELFCGFRSCGA